ncbi:hypothetical protein M885DRAFT_42822 [Pelagophyceae sp. CCMP2097]|nr:hypothetical protein M885DRAFT_42822 [Pelagophyceae sp. CCMP2097]
MWARLARRWPSAAVGGPAARRFAGRGTGETELYVSNLPRNTTEDAVRKAFSAALGGFRLGVVRLPKDRGSGMSRGFAFIAVESGEALRIVAETNGATLMNAGMSFQITVAVAQTKMNMKPQDERAIALNKELITLETPQELLTLFDESQQFYDAVNLATSLHRLGAMNSGKLRPTEWLGPQTALLLQDLVDAAAKSITSDEAKWPPRLIANACWGVAKMGRVKSSALFGAVAVAAPCKIAEFKPQELANTVWAFAKVGSKSPALFDAVSAESVRQIGAFKAQELANTVWAFAKSGYEAAALFEAVAAEAPRQIGAFKPQELTNLVWSFSKATFHGVQAPGIFESVSKEAVRKINTFGPSDLANIVWVYAKAPPGIEAPELFDTVAAAAMTKLPSFECRDLVGARAVVANEYPLQKAWVRLEVILGSS